MCEAWESFKEGQLGVARGRRERGERDVILFQLKHCLKSSDEHGKAREISVNNRLQVETEILRVRLIKTITDNNLQCIHKQNRKEKFPGTKEKAWPLVTIWLLPTIDTLKPNKPFPHQFIQVFITTGSKLEQ